MNAKELPFKIKIASPCPARWLDMTGDDRVRFCDLCHKNVYNLSAMTAAEAAALLKEKQGRLCARMYQRRDGTLLAADCPVGIARHWWRLKSIAAGGFAAILFMFTYTKAMGREEDSEYSMDELRYRVADIGYEMKWSFLGLFGKSRPVLMGMVANISPTSPPPAVPAPAPTAAAPTDKQQP